VGVVIGGEVEAEVIVGNVRPIIIYFQNIEFR
jgi:hypothetical protein